MLPSCCYFHAPNYNKILATVDFLMLLGRHSSLKHTFYPHSSCRIHTYTLSCYHVLAHIHN